MSEQTAWSREEWERAHAEAMQARDWLTCEILVDERETCDWYLLLMACAGCQGDPGGVHICGQELAA